jgi:hypothetical protein
MAYRPMPGGMARTPATSRPGPQYFAGMPSASGGGNPRGPSVVPQGTLPVAPNAQSIGTGQVSNLVNNYREYGLSGSVTTPMGETYSTPAASPGPGGANPPGTSPIDLNDLWNRSGMFGDGGAAPPVMPTPAHVTGPSEADRSASEAAIYGRAKDKVGLETRASMNALAGEMGSRGMSDSTFMANAAGGILQQGQMNLSDTDRTQAIEALKRKSDVEDRNYAGDVSQRGQDIGVAEANANRQAQALAARRAMFSELIRLRSASGGRLY